MRWYHWILGAALGLLLSAGPARSDALVFTFPETYYDGTPLPPGQKGAISVYLNGYTFPLRYPYLPGDTMTWDIGIPIVSVGVISHMGWKGGRTSTYQFVDFTAAVTDTTISWVKVRVIREGDDIRVEANTEQP